jgi:hypothetical protein
MRLRPSTWGKITAGVLVIVGVLVGLWAAFRPSVDPAVRVQPPPKPPVLEASHADVRLERAGAPRADRAAIRCNGRDESATGFWRGNPREACDALASSRAGLLSGAGCSRPDPRATRLRVTGAFGSRRFDHRAQDLGCRDVDVWLSVNALAAPVLVPPRKATDAARTG